MKRIMSSQLADMDKQLADISHDRAIAINESTQLKSRVKSLQSNIAATRDRVTASDNQVKQLQSKITASEDVNSRKIAQLEKQIDSLEKENLKYKQKIQSSSQLLQDKDDNIAELETKLNETVTAARSIKSASSNRDAEIEGLKSELAEANKIIAGYQDAYANLYASAVGVSLNNVSVTASTSVSQLKQMIKSSTVVEETPIADVAPMDTGDDGLVTL